MFGKVMEELAEGARNLRDRVKNATVKVGSQSAALLAPLKKKFSEDPDDSSKVSLLSSDPNPDSDQRNFLYDSDSTTSVIIFDKKSTATTVHGIPDYSEEDTFSIASNEPFVNVEELKKKKKKRFSLKKLKSSLSRTPSTPVPIKAKFAFGSQTMTSTTSHVNKTCVNNDNDFVLSTSWEFKKN